MFSSNPLSRQVNDNKRPGFWFFLKNGIPNNDQCSWSTTHALYGNNGELHSSTPLRRQHYTSAVWKWGTWNAVLNLTPGHSRFRLNCPGCLHSNPAAGRRAELWHDAALWKSVLGTICWLSVLEPQGEARQWMQVHTRLAVASDLSSISFSVSERLLGKHWTTTWYCQHTC